MSDTPSISVLLPVYNSRDYIQEAVESVLEQSFTDIELILIDDASSDDSFVLLESFRDNRIRLYQNKTNMKLPATLNRGLGLARGKYIARMDADDICLPGRLEKQFRFMETHPEIGVSGTWSEYIGAISNRIFQTPVDFAGIRARMFFECCLVHPSVILRRSFLEEYDLRYSESADYYHAEDYELWTRCLELSRVGNLGEVLLKYRIHSSQIGARYGSEQNQASNRIRARLLKNLCETCGEDETELHNSLITGEYSLSLDYLENALRWITRLYELNKEKELYDSVCFAEELNKIWFFACYNLTGHGLKTHRAFQRARFPGVSFPGLSLRIKFFLKCLAAHKNQNWQEIAERENASTK